MNETIDEKRLAKVMALTLKSGAHEGISKGACVMEAVAYVAGEKWSDHPQCASPVIAAFLRSWNDSLDDEARNRLLKPLIPKLVGTAASEDTEQRRNYLALDWLIRVFTPKWLDLVPSLHEHAKALRDLEGIADMAGAAAAGEKVRLARDAARDAAWDAARAAAWATAGAAARAAARATAGAAAWAAAGAAAGAALKPTKEWLQASALNLVERMLEVK